MARIFIALFLQVVLLAANIQIGESIKCYVCNSQQNSKCADPVDRSGLEPKECSLNVINEAMSVMRKGVDALHNVLGIQGIPEAPNLNYACQKMDLSVSDQPGNKLTIRSCSIAKREDIDPCTLTDSLPKFADGKGKVEFCQMCETDLCNGASQHFLTTMSVFVVPCFAFIFSRWIVV